MPTFKILNTLAILLLIFGTLQVASFEYIEEGKPCKTESNQEGTYKTVSQCLSPTDYNTTADGSQITCCPKVRDVAEGMHDLFPQTCGRVMVGEQAERIVGGKPSRPGSWPWLAAIGFRTKILGPFWFCAGSLISSRLVITAAHCNFHPQAYMYKVRLGDIFLHSDDQLRYAWLDKPQVKGIEIPIQRVIPHQAYTRGRLRDDIALIKLEYSVEFTNYIQPICLPPPSIAKRNLTGYTPTAAGWGATVYQGKYSKVLNEVQLPVVDNQACYNAFIVKGNVITSSHLCAGYAKGGRDACQGDSGGPLMLPVGDAWFLIGISSYGYKCAQPGFPGVYTRVTDFMNWIVDTAAII